MAIRSTPRRVDRLRVWIDEVMKDTDAFFTPAPTSDYTFSPATGRDGGAGRSRAR